MQFNETKARVHDHGGPPDEFLTELVEWARSAHDEIFARTETVGSRDIYNKVFAELGPYENLLHRKAVMLEVMRVLAGFESSWDWKEGVDVSRLGIDTPENAEAGAWQVSYDSRHLAPGLWTLLLAHDVKNGVTFQKAMKFDHPLAMEYVACLMRHNTKHNGPLYKGDERLAIRRSLRNPEHSIYPWLSHNAVLEFESLLT